MMHRDCFQGTKALWITCILNIDLGSWTLLPAFEKEREAKDTDSRLQKDKTMSSAE